MRREAIAYDVAITIEAVIGIEAVIAIDDPLSLYPSSPTRSMIPHFYARDFVETQEGWVFALIADGPIDGKLWGTLRYRRVDDRWEKLNSQQANDLLVNDPLGRLRYVETFDTCLPTLELSQIRQHYDPLQRLSHTLSNPKNEVSDLDFSSSPYRSLTLLVDWLVAQQVPRETLGITGSWLLNAQTSSSDFDLIIVGKANFDLARKALATGIECGLLSPLDSTLWQQAHAKRGTSMTFDEYRWHEERKGIHASIAGTKIDLSLRVPSQLPEPGKKIGRAEVTARVIDDHAAFELPARWTIDHPTITEVVTWTATFVGQVQKSEKIEALGTVEQTADGKQRLVIGADREAVSDHLKVLRT